MSKEAAILAVFLIVAVLGLTFFMRYVNMLGYFNEQIVQTLSHKEVRHDTRRNPMGIGPQQRGQGKHNRQRKGTDRVSVNRLDDRAASAQSYARTLEH